MATLASAPLLPRYRRPLTVGGILDETIQLYRRAWVSMAAIMALCAVPAGLVGLALGGGSMLLLLLGAGSDVRLEDALAPFYTLTVALVLLWSVGVMLAGAAAVVLTDGLLRGMRGSAWHAFRVGIGRLLPLLGGSLAYLMGLLLLGVLGVPAALLWVFPGLFGLTPLLALVIWAVSPRSRRGWLKWLIVLTTPLGLVVYYSVRWSLYSLPVLLEGSGPLAALRRSGDLVRGHWFRVFGVELVIAIVVSVLQSVPGGFVWAAGALAGLAEPPYGATSPVLLFASNFGGIVGWVLFGALSFISATLLFVDLRNRREGADLAERVALVEAVAAP